MNDENTKYIENLLDQLINKTKNGELNWGFEYPSYYTDLYGKRIYTEYDTDFVFSHSKLYINGERVFYDCSIWLRSIPKKIKRLNKLIEHHREQQKKTHDNELAKSILDELRREELIVKVAGIDDD